MKKILFFLMLMLFGVTAHASEVYVVTTNSLNMRAKPKSSAHKLGSLRKGEIIKVDTIINGWATCVNEAGETFYVSSKHLVKKEDAEAKKKAENDKEYGVPPTWTLQQKIRKALAYTGIEVSPSPSTTPFSWVFFLCFGGAAVIAVLYYILKYYSDEDLAFVVGALSVTVVGTIMSAFELWCIIMYDGDPAWFCSIDRNVLTIIFWLLISLVILCAQVFILIGMNAFASGALGSDSDDFDFLGPVSTYIFAGIYLVLYLFLSSLQPYVVGLFILSQIVHLVLQLIDLENKSVMGLAVFGLYAICYLIISAATFLMIVTVVSHLFYLASNVSFWWYVGIIAFIIFVTSVIVGGESRPWDGTWNFYDQNGRFLGSARRKY